MAAPPELKQSEKTVLAPPVLSLPAVEPHRRARSPSPGAEEEDGGGCQTPRSKESRLPAVTTCPPAPKKRRQKEVSCKRRLPEVELFHVGPELLWRVFRPLDSRSSVCTSSPAVKKRKRCYPDEE